MKSFFFHFAPPFINLSVFNPHDIITEKTPIPQMEAWEGSGSGGEAPAAASPPRDLLLDRVYSDSEEEREYQVCGPTQLI